MADKLPSKEIQDDLKYVVEYFEKEDIATRQQQIRQWKELKYYWNGFTNIWWSEVAHDFRTWSYQNIGNDTNNDSAYYDKRVNVFRAYLESIIAALSVNIPSVRCQPDDPDNPLDISTAKAGDIISQQVYKHNDVILLWLHALYIYCTEGMIAAYNYPKEDYEYGSYEVNEYEDAIEENYICPNCGVNIPDEQFTNQLRDQFQPDDSSIELDDVIINQGQVICPQCAVALDPMLQKEPLTVTRLVGVTSKPKSRQCIECYGGLYVKVANYAIQQKDTPYLIFAYETNYVNVLERYPHLSEQIKGSGGNVSQQLSGLNDPYERWGRLPINNWGDYPKDTPTVRNCWLRPCAFNVLDKEKADRLKKLYPDGAKVVLANDLFAGVCNEALDDCWTLTYNPLSDYLHHEPLGNLLKSVQDITNDLVSLTLQTIEHGITQMFVDPAVVNLNAYKQSEVRPGDLFAAKPVSGKSVGDAFFQAKTATLSGEVLPFGEKIQELGQTVSGAQPQIFGGAAPNSSKTAAQYSMARAQALQRLQTPWKMLTVWWKNIFGKVIPAYIQDIQSDERFVTKDKLGNYVNVFVRKAQLAGKIGEIELEASENVPLTWSQRKDVLMQLMQAGNPMVMEALADPENLPLLKEAIGLYDFQLPGEDDRQKQYEEIRLLVESEPITIPGGIGPDGMPTEQQLPSIEVDPLLDNHQLEADICRRWLISDAGRITKIENPPGYHNVLLHMQAHMMIIQQQMMQSQQQGNAAPGNENEGNKNPQQTNSNDSGNNNQQQKPVAQQVKQNVGTF